MKKNIDLSPNIETLFGTHDENLHLLEDGLNVSIDLKSDSIEIHGSPAEVARAEQVFADYEHLRRSGFSFQNGDGSSLSSRLSRFRSFCLRRCWVFIF